MPDRVWYNRPMPFHVSEFHDEIHAAGDAAEPPAVAFARTVLGHEFRDPALLASALTHRSYRAEHPDGETDNQRLEFLGDAVLEILSSDLLYRRFPAADEGALSRLRSRITDERALAGIARRIGLGSRLLVGIGAEAQGSRDLDAVLADAMEAVVGAIYLDGGVAAADAVFRKLFAPEIDALDTLPASRWAGNPKGQLQQVAATLFHADPVYAELSRQGPDHAPVFVAEVRLGRFRAEGRAGNKRKAEALAAEGLLRQLAAGNQNAPEGTTDAPDVVY